MESKKVLNTATGNLVTVNGQQYNKLLKLGYYRQGNKLFPPESSSESSVEEVTKQLEKQTLEPLAQQRNRCFVETDIVYDTFALPRVRCVECNKPIGCFYKRYDQLKREGVTPIDIFTLLNIKRPCCRMHLEHPQQLTLLEYNSNLVEGDLPRDTAQRNPLSQNPLLQPKEELITYVEGNRPPMLKTKIVKDNQVFYEPVTTSQLRQKPIAGGKYYVSYK